MIFMFLSILPSFFIVTFNLLSILLLIQSFMSVQSTWDRLSLCSWCTLCWFHLFLLYSQWPSAYWYLHQGPSSVSFSWSILQVGHLWSLCSNLGGVLVKILKISSEYIHIFYYCTRNRSLLLGILTAMYIAIQLLLDHASNYGTILGIYYIGFNIQV